MKITIHLPECANMTQVPDDLVHALKSGNDGREFDYDEVNDYFLTYVGIHPAYGANKIQAIKEVRRFFGCGLLDAKQTVEGWLHDNTGPPAPLTLFKSNLTKDELMDEVVEATRLGIIVSVSHVAPDVSHTVTVFDEYDKRRSEGLVAQPARVPRHLGDMLDSYRGGGNNTP